MYQSTVSFQAPLEPRSFFAADACALETRHVFQATWQLVGRASSVSQPGQYLSAEPGGVPVVVRNFEGELVALRNVCAHRHCQLVSSPLGQGDKLKCPFHGWEYGADGRTRRIPAAKNFPDFDRDLYRLTIFPLEQCGDLLFVRIAEQGPSLRDFLGQLYDRIAEWTSLPTWQLAISRTLTVPANWKIPVEGSLESYHIPEVHPQTFAEDPGESNSEHAFADYSTSFFTSFSTRRVIDRLLKFCEFCIFQILGVSRTGRYEHHHVFPNLLVSHTDSLTLVQLVRPVAVDMSASDIWQYRRQSARRNPISKLTAVAWGRFMGWLTSQILKEDLGVFPQVQRGERAAPNRSILGRCEERLYAFETFIRDQIVTGQKCTVKTATSNEFDSWSCGTTECDAAEVGE